jgi:hypothetical protein
MTSNWSKVVMQCYDSQLMMLPLGMIIEDENHGMFLTRKCRSMNLTAHVVYDKIDEH